MTITVTQISGDTNYIAPDLRKEDIKVAIASSDYLNGFEYPIPLYSEQHPLEDPWLFHNLDFIIPPTLPEDELPPLATSLLAERMEHDFRKDSGNKSKLRTNKNAMAYFLNFFSPLHNIQSPEPTNLTNKPSSSSKPSLTHTPAPKIVNPHSPITYHICLHLNRCTLLEVGAP